MQNKVERQPQHSVSPERQRIADPTRAKVLKYLKDNDLMVEVSMGVRVFDTGAIAEHPFRYTKTDGRTENEQKTGFRFIDMLDTLRGLRGYDSDEYMDALQHGDIPVQREVMALPESIADLDKSFPARSRDSIVDPTTLIKFRTWNRMIRLESGESVSFAEMVFAARALDEKSLHVHRDASGTLVMRDHRTGQFEQFTAQRFVELTGLDFTTKVGEEEQRLFSDRPYEVAKVLMPNLCAAGLLLESDFVRRGGSPMAEKYGAHRRKLTGPYVMFASPNGMTARYYVGKETIVGTDIRINRETMSAIQLDPRTVAIMEQVHGREQIVCTIDLLSGGEMEDFHKELQRNEESRGITRTSAERQSYAVLKARDVAPRVRRYELERHIPRRADESEGAYRARLLRLNDASFVLKEFRTFFQEAGVTVHQLPWEEQVLLADAITTEANRETWLRFGREFGLEGIRTLLALSYDRSMKDQIFVLAERSPEAAREIFAAFVKLVDGSRAIAEVTQDVAREAALSVDEHVRNDFPVQLREGILRRAKDALYTASAIVRSGRAAAVAYGTRQLVCTNLYDVSRSLGIYASTVEKTCDLLRGATGEKYQFRLTSVHKDQVPVLYEFIVENVPGHQHHRSYMLLQLREKGAPVGQHNANFEFDGEARINLVFSEKPMGLSVHDGARRAAVSLRIDREGKDRQNGQIVANDPTRQDGAVSLEIGGFGENQKDASDNATVGNVFAIGNAYATADATGDAHRAQYYHNRESFERALGDANVFASLVRFIQKRVEESYQVKKR